MKEVSILEENNVSVPKASPPKAPESSSGDESSSGGKSGNSPGGKVGNKIGKEGAKAGAGAVGQAAASSAIVAGAGNMAAKGVAAAGGLVDKMIGAVMAPIKAIGGAIGKGIGAITGGVSKVAGAVGGFFGGVGSGIASIGVAIVSAGVIVVGGVGMTSQSASETAGSVFNQVINDDDDCKTLSATTGDTEGGSSLTDAQVMKNAYVIYSALTQYGLTAAQAYGMLANMYHESHLYPSMVQGHISAPLFGKSIANPADYSDNGGGVGLVQWTPVVAKTALQNAAIANSLSWYSLEFQVSFILSAADVNWSATQTYIKKTASFSAADSCKWFLKNWERCSGSTTASDYTDPGKSGTYYNKRWKTAQADVESIELTIQQCLINYSGDIALNSTVTNILAHASAMVTEGAINATASSACTYGTYDNSSVANAAISFSWAEKPLAYNNGTALYQKVYNNILTDKIHYKSCDRSVICAVAWSGTDDNFAGLGGVAGIYSYLNGTTGVTKWTNIGIIGAGISMADCQPGDILIITAEQRGKKNGHVVIFTGVDAIMAVHGDAAPVGANVIAASLDDYSPCAQVWSDSTAANYTLYRCTAPDMSTTFAGAGGNEAAVQPVTP